MNFGQQPPSLIADVSKEPIGQFLVLYLLTLNLVKPSYQWRQLFMLESISFPVWRKHTSVHTNSMALSPRANYTDWTTATCQRNFSANFRG
jgi:hypothetical protein